SMPHCIDSVDGKHCRIQCPPNAGSQFYKHKGFHSVVLLAVADAECNFILLAVGGFDRDNDRYCNIFCWVRVLRRIFGPKRDEVTGGWRKLHNLYSSPSIIRMLKSRRMRRLLGSVVNRRPRVGNRPGDDFLREWPTLLISPYARRQLNNEKRLFNYRSSRARRTVECAFGILVRKFGMFTHSVSTSLKLAEASIKSALYCIIIHGSGRKKQKETWREFLEQTNVPPVIGLRPTPAHRGGAEAIETRNKLTAYFSR
ncbi:hypothetical protein B7P43_G03722, partial [Cryptotermes secundus]